MQSVGISRLTIKLLSEALGSAAISRHSIQSSSLSDLVLPPTCVWCLPGDLSAGRLRSLD